MKLRTMATTVLLLVAVLGVCAISCAGPATSFDGERLGACPPSPNCVCSDRPDGDDGAVISPLEIPAGVEAGAAFEAFMGLVAERASIESRQDGYFHAVFTTRILRFRDDFEARLDPAAGVIHVRSASRLGHSDLGANRRRVEDLRSAFLDSLQ